MQASLATDVLYDNNSKRSANRDKLRALIVEAFSSMTIEQVVERLELAQIANARVNEMKDVWAHPQLQARERWVQVGSPAGPLPALLPPASNNQFQARMDPVPDIGQHTRAILSELGVKAEAIERMQAAKAI